MRPPVCDLGEVPLHPWASVSSFLADTAGDGGAMLPRPCSPWLGAGDEAMSRQLGFPLIFQTDALGETPNPWIHFTLAPSVFGPRRLTLKEFPLVESHTHWLSGQEAIPL